jgi:hypothetical protein
MKIETFSATQPVFKPEDFLAGHLQGWGIIDGPLGGLQRRASIKASGTFDVPTQVIEFTEVWTFDDGHLDTLRWRITRLGEGRYSGEEPTLEGQALGEQAGCAFHWTYTRNVPSKDGGATRVNFDDWFFRVDETGLVIKGSAGRIGIPFATAFVTYRKL